MRPRYMLNVSTALPATEKSPMQPVESPQVVNADVDSKMMFFNGTSGSKSPSVTTVMKMKTKDMTTME